MNGSYSLGLIRQVSSACSEWSGFCKASVASPVHKEITLLVPYLSTSRLRITPNHHFLIRF